jgi:hypothetical protein
VSFFLLWRNHKLWGNPFYNMNVPLVWIDQWRDVWAMKLSPDWNKLGLGWYLQRHSMGRLVFELGRAAIMVIGYFVYTAGIGPDFPVSRGVTGAAVIVLAALGLRRRWRAGRRLEVVAVLGTVAFFYCGLTLAARGGSGAQIRFVLPYVTLLVPYAVYEALERFWPPLRARLEAARWARFSAAGTALAAIALLLFARLAFAAPRALVNPRRSYAVEPRWHETSEWFSRALVPGESFAMDSLSYYSTWDLPRPDTDPRWQFWFIMPSGELMSFMDRSHIRKVLIDTASSSYPEHADKLSRERDAHGPLAFLGWPRCFADSATPSRFLVYCRP